MRIRCKMPYGSWECIEVLLVMQECTKHGNEIVASTFQMVAFTLFDPDGPTDLQTTWLISSIVSDATGRWIIWGTAVMKTELSSLKEGLSGSPTYVLGITHWVPPCACKLMQAYHDLGREIYWSVRVGMITLALTFERTTCSCPSIKL